MTSSFFCFFCFFYLGFLSRTFTIHGTAGEDNLRIDGLQEVENETWEQTEKILKNMIQEKLEIEDVNIERAHRVDNTSNTLPNFLVLRESNLFFLLPKS